MCHRVVGISFMLTVDLQFIERGEVEDMDMEERRKILDMYKDLEWLHGRDGMDWCGYHHYGAFTIVLNNLMAHQSRRFCKNSQIFAL